MEHNNTAHKFAHLTTPLRACRQWPLHRVCHKYILPFCEGMQSAKFDKRQADPDNTVRGAADALHLIIKVGTDRHMQPYGVCH